MEYVAKPNVNLICSICHSPFQDPVTVPCEHTFCKVCLLRHMETSLFCPLDRLPLNKPEEWIKSKIVCLMVDELIVYCKNKANGCEWTGERLLLDSHCKDCPYELLECPYCMELVVKINEHVSNCNKREVPCPKCDQKVIYEALATHDETCTSKQAECPHCLELFDSQSLDGHIRNCPLKQTACEYSQFGCGWSGIVSDLKDHLNACPLSAIKGFIQIHQQQINSLKEENQKLVEAIGDLESHCYRLNCKILEMETNRIFTENMPGVPPVVIDNLALDVQLLKSELENLNMNLAHSELKHDQQFLAENIRLRDEMQALRAICQSVQTQLYNLAIHKSNNPNINIKHKSTNSKLGKPVDGNPLNKL